jgi:hypothetical protein
VAKTAPVIVDESPPKVEVKPEPVKPIVDEISREQKEFMEDCMSLTNKTSVCEDLWKQRSQ